MNDEKPPKRDSAEQVTEPKQSQQMHRPIPQVNNGAKPEEEEETQVRQATASIEQLPVKTSPAMQQPDTSTRRSRGRLSRNTLETLGRVLDVFYEDVRKEGVPDRFKDLLQQFDERKDKGQT